MAAKTREFDVVVFGASGFTGKYVVYELLNKSSPGVKVAIAGRSQTKVRGARHAAHRPRCATYPLL